MTIRELIKQDAGFQYVIEHMELMSAAGRRAMLNCPFTANAEALEKEWLLIGDTLEVLSNHDKAHAYNDLRHCLMQLHDLQGTLASLATRTTLNEVELFEIKNLAYLNGKAHTALATLQMADAIALPDLQTVFNLLDPDRTGVANFYIYDTYDHRLTPLRSELRSLQEHDGDPQRIGELIAQQNEIQQAVCTLLSDQLTTHGEALATALERMAYADLLFAKAELTRLWGLSHPSIANRMDYRGLFNPRLRDRNAALGLRYQPVDIASGKADVTVITGANMAGKTVLLKSLSTAQMMVQCGFYATAEAATVTLFDNVMSSIGDEQDEMNGLSSYASEITKISDIVSHSRTERLLVLIDEPARTTNPVEGKALVQAIIRTMLSANCATFITTHYSQLGCNCRRLRVKGFVEEMADVPLTPQNIGRFIDYSLTEDDSDEVPHEALRIAAILGCDKELLDTAAKLLEE